MDDFDRHFRSTRRLALGGFIISAIVKLAIIGGLIWLAVYAIDAFA